MGEINPDKIERAEFSGAASLELIKSIAARRKSIARNIEKSWAATDPWNKDNSEASGSLSAL